MAPEDLTFAEQADARAHLERYPPESEVLAMLCWLLASKVETRDALARRWPGALSFVAKSAPSKPKPGNPLLERLTDG